MTRRASMNFAEKSLYHQIHPVKLVVDVSTSLCSLYFFWQHDIVSGLLIGFLPSVIISFVIIRFANLEKYKESALGRYVAKHMTNGMQAVRASGQVLAWAGAWYHLTSVIVAGLLLILFAWLRGKLSLPV